MCFSPIKKGELPGQPGNAYKTQRMENLGNKLQAIPQ